MEQKKLPQADLNNRRTTGFLLGLILVLSLIYVAFEFNMSEALGFDPTDLLDDDEEAELAPLFKPEQQLIMLAPEEQSAPAEKLNIVEDNVELQPEELKVDNNDEGESDEQKLEEILDETEEIAPPEINPRDNPEQFRIVSDMPQFPGGAVAFRVVEDLPQFPGGAVEFMKWLTKNLRYPTSAQQRKIQGKVVAQFLVNEDGSITDIKLTKKLHPQCDNEALRVLKMMPRWTPGIENNKPCRTRVCIPIVFKL